MQILLATGNKKKRAEFERLFAPLGIELMPAGPLPDTIEDQATFAGNAAKKASEAARAYNAWALADDSGLEVAHLGGAPGVHSARYAGTHGDDDANNLKLLADLAGVSTDQRAARFVCALCLCRPDGSVALEVQGTANGRILTAPRGTHDFGYDPLFEFTEPGFAVTGRAFAELEPDEKATVSHRARALRALAERLIELG
jgi:XTP/dITP diphosphohydrolase